MGVLSHLDRQLGLLPCRASNEISISAFCVKSGEENNKQLVSTGMLIRCPNPRVSIACPSLFGVVIENENYC
jgi:hypothetical protein